MNVLTVMGTAHKGNTRAVVDLFLKEFDDDNNSFDELVLPNDFNNFCMGCANCILKGEDKCPHYNEVSKIVERIEKADLIILATPVFVGSCSGSMKAFLDHLAYMWLVHRPNEKMFNKVIIDLSQLEFMDSTGIGVMLGRYKKLQSRNIPIYIINPSNQAEKIFQMAGLYDIMPKIS